MRIPQSLTRNLSRKILVVKKNSPHIFFAAGVVGVATSTVLACKATLKLEETLDEISKDVESVNNVHHANRISDQEHKRLVALKTVRGVGKVARLYAVPAAVGVASIGLLAGSHVQLTKRNSALSATLAMVSKSFTDYRERVRGEVGEDREEELYRCMEDNEIEVDGKKKKTKTVNPKAGMSPYARLYSKQTSSEWYPNPELNRNFLTCQQNYFNHILTARGYVMLNDVYDRLGLERCSAGQVVGWVLNNEKGDGYIDFGLYRRPENAQWMIGDEDEVWLDFNVDGEVFRLIDEVAG